MKTHLIFIWDKLRESYWFLPALLCFLAMVLGLFLPVLERDILELLSLQIPQWLETTNQAARSTLSVIASSMLGIAGTVFSVTVVTLSLTSQQFGPRLLRTFMSDRSTQCTLGVLLATGVYALLVLRIVEEHKEIIDYPPPHLSLMFAILLTILSAAMLIFFIHRITVLIQAPSVVEAVAKDLDAALERLFPDLRKLHSTDINFQARKAAATGVDKLEIPSSKEGYIQALDDDGLFDFAKRNNAFLDLLKRPGHFVRRGEVFIAAYGFDKIDEDGIESELNESLLVGNRRTPRQDLECVIEELVEVAVRALSPGINDPFTAVSCVDRLGAFLPKLLNRAFPNPYRLDESGALRLCSPEYSFPAILDTAYNQIRQHGRENLAVTIRILETLRPLAALTAASEDAAAVRKHAEMILESSKGYIHTQADREDLNVIFREVIEILTRRGDSAPEINRAANHKMI